MPILTINHKHKSAATEKNRLTFKIARDYVCCLYLVKFFMVFSFPESETVPYPPYSLNDEDYLYLAGCFIGLFTQHIQCIYLKHILSAVVDTVIKRKESLNTETGGIST